LVSLYEIRKDYYRTPSVMLAHASFLEEEALTVICLVWL